MHGILVDLHFQICIQNDSIFYFKIDFVINCIQEHFISFRFKYLESGVMYVTILLDGEKLIDYAEILVTKVPQLIEKIIITEITI